MRARTLIVAAGSVLALAGLTRADDPVAPADRPGAAPPVRPAPAAKASPAADPDADALRGPSVSPRAERKDPSIVERDFDGRLKRPEDHPAILALAKLDLDADSRAKVDAAVAERNALLDGLVRDNLLDLAALNNARQSGDRAESRRLLGVLMERARPITARGTLTDEIKRALPIDAAARFDRMIAEYRAAAVKDRMSGPGEDGQTPGRLGAVLGEGLQDFGLEIKRSYERTFQAGGKEFDQLIKDLGLTPEQEGRVRQKVTDAFLAANGKMTKLQTAKVFLEVYGDLTPDQRKLLAERIRQERLDAADARRKRG